MQATRKLGIVPLAVLAALSLMVAALVLPSAARAASLDSANLLKGEYTVEATMVNASDTTQTSVANGALTNPVTITVDASHAYTASLEMVPITMGKATAYMQSLSYWDGMQYQPATVDKTYEGISDGFGAVNPPEQLSFPLVNKAAGDENGLVKLQVDVPIIAAMSGGRAPSTQNVYLSIDWTTLKQTKALEKVSGGVTYLVSGKNAKVTSIAKSAKSANVKSTVKIGSKSYKVTSIAKKAAYKATKLKKVVLGKNLKSIGNNAFRGIAKKATFTCPKAKLAKYKKLVKKAGAPKTAKFKAA